MNAMIDLASANGSNFYSYTWHGPPASTYTSEGMIAAADALGIAAGIDGSSNTVYALSLILNVMILTI
jgi:hypothetical protein